MSLLLVSKNRDFSALEEYIHSIDSNIDVEIWPAVSNPDRVQFAVAWNHPTHFFSGYPNLQAISSFGAGVEHLINDTSIPQHITLTRMVLPSLAQQISDYVLMSVLNILRRSHSYNKQQRKANWETHQSIPKETITIGIMGLGKLGTATAQKLALNGFRVAGWSRSKKEIESVETYATNELSTFLKQVNILICLLPLTQETKAIIDLNVLKQLKQPAFIINAGRGEHLVDEDLIYALDIGTIEHAVLDVFIKEPLPESHPFWNRDKITITPHTASITDEKQAAELIVENYKRLLSGMELLYRVDRNLEY